MPRYILIISSLWGRSFHAPQVFLHTLLLIFGMSYLDNDRGIPLYAMSIHYTPELSSLSSWEHSTSYSSQGYL